MSKNQWKALALTLAGILTSVLLLLGAVLVPPIAEAQVTSISQFSDVQPTDWYFTALQSLIERWGIVSGYADGTFRADSPETRGGVASLINSAMNTISELQSAQTSDLATQEQLRALQTSIEQLQASVQSFHAQLR